MERGTPTSVIGSFSSSHVHAL